MANFGEALKREREQRDVPLRDIANATKINLRYLEALEQNRFDKLPGGVFNKGFIRAYARFIGADGEALVERYMEQMAEKEATTAGLQPSPHRPGALRPPHESPRRRDSADRASEPAAGAGPAITFGEARTAAAAPGSRTDFLPSAATVPLRSAGEGFQQARLLLAGTTVVAAFAALGTVFYLVRSAQHEPRTDAPSHDAAPAGIPESPDSGAAEEAAPSSPEPQILDGDKQAAPSGDPAGAPSGDPSATPPGAAGPGSTPPPVKPDARPLPEIPRQRNGAPSPVRVASPIPGPQEPIEGTARKPARAPGAPAPAPVPVTPSSNTPNPAVASPVNPPAIAAAPTGPMAIAVTAVSPVTVILGCDGSDRPARTMLAGETVNLKCYSLVRISAEDAGAVRLTLDGAACPSLGASGRVEHFTIRAEDARAICPQGAGSGAHGRR
ncbi:MAG TPA: helix-turn-helix domain-containing protein [Candidatus Polarisedimenticolia bacterium]|jgi:transcriptional regulator with XRE-family HTH domain|nr:helix-turn-helix domain-containing protein [Candidatus Polarisedimenticolia bacterium]